MITIQSGKLIIPEEDRFVGFAGDNLGNIKRFVLPGHGSDNGSYTLCLRFDDDSVRTIVLEKSLSGSDLVLTWNILSAHLLKAGIVMAQIKSVDSDDVILHTSCDYFIVAESADADGELEYVLRDELEERMTAFLGQIRDSAPYIGEDGYWYVYDIESDSFVRDACATAQITIDDALTAGGVNPVKGGAIKAYVDSGLGAKADKTTKIAGHPLSGDISRAELFESLHTLINPPLVQPESTVGYGGQYGRTADGAPVMCALANTWLTLATTDDLASKMALAPTADNMDFSGIPAGQVFFCQGGVLIKTQLSFIELALKNNVYSKNEINAMIGNLESLLSNV